MPVEKIKCLPVLVRTLRQVARVVGDAGAIGQVQKVLDDKLAVLASFTFSTMYYLPGSGTSSQGDHAENADTHLAVAVLS